MRSGNFFYELPMQGEVHIVHRGVSQGGRKLAPAARRRFWKKYNQKVAGIAISHEKVVVSLKGLREMRQKAFVIVSNPEKPRVWTPKRIVKFAKKVQIMMKAETAGACQRRGGLKL